MYGVLVYSCDEMQEECYDGALGITVCTLIAAFLFSSCRNSVLLTMKNILMIRKLST